MPPDQTEGRTLSAGNDHTLPPGTKTTITLAPAVPGAKPTASYSFAIGDLDYQSGDQQQGGQERVQETSSALAPAAVSECCQSNRSGLY
jgi:hypothetical protein